MECWIISWAQATNEIMRLLGLHSNYSSLPEAERMKLLAEAISTPPPADKVEVCMCSFFVNDSFYRSHKEHRASQSVHWGSRLMFVYQPIGNRFSWNVLPQSTRWWFGFCFYLEFFCFYLSGFIQDYDRTIEGSSGAILCLCWYYGECFTEIHSLLCYFHDPSSLTCDGSMFFDLTFSLASNFLRIDSLLWYLNYYMSSLD